MMIILMMILISLKNLDLMSLKREVKMRWWKNMARRSRKT